MTNIPLAYYRTVVSPKHGLAPGDCVHVDFGAADWLSPAAKGSPEYQNVPVVSKGSPVYQPLEILSDAAPSWVWDDQATRQLSGWLHLFTGASKVIALDHNFVGTTSNAHYKLPAGVALHSVKAVDAHRQAFVVKSGGEKLPGVVNSASPFGPVVCVAQVFDPRKTSLVRTTLDVQNAARLSAAAKQCSSTHGSLPLGKPVVFFTTSIGPWGGVIALNEIVTGLRDVGVNAHIVTCREHPHKIHFGVTPHRVRTTGYLPEYLRQTFGTAGILVATHWNSVEGVVPALNTLPGWRGVAYWQDREDLFVDPTGVSAVNSENARLYTSIKDKVLNASWLGEGAIIPVGYDPRVFNPEGRRKIEKPEVVRVLAMHRPSTPRRGAKRLEQLYRNLRRTYGSRVRLSVFGEPARVADWFDEHLGPLCADGVATAMRDAHVFVEPSEFQGFGLPGLEALACGAFLISTDNKGIHEYGTNDVDCLIDDNLEASFAKYMALTNEQVHQFWCSRDAYRFRWPVICDQWRDWLVCLDREVLG